MRKVEKPLSTVLSATVTEDMLRRIQLAVIERRKTDPSRNHTVSEFVRDAVRLYLNEPSL